MPLKTSAFAVFAALSLCQILGPIPASAAMVSGATVQWQPLVIDVLGPSLNEADLSPNPFLDVRLDVSLIAPSGNTYLVPGFFAGDGQGQGTGSVWRIRFAPDEPGSWQYQVSFRQGSDVAVANDPDAGVTLAAHGETGTIEIDATDPDAPGFLKYGRLEHVGKHYLKFGDGPFWIKGGVDSPENFFAYAGFDNTQDNEGGVNKSQLQDGVHHYSGHRADWQTGDPDFISETTGVDAKGIIGAVNYLSLQAVNSMYFLPMNLGGDGTDTHPFIEASGTAEANTHYDVSKLYQWNIVLDHMQRKAIAAHLVLAEEEVPNRQWLDGGQLGTERMLFYRELVARFAYLNGIKWNISEESRYTPEVNEAFARHIRTLDWAQHPIAVHSLPDRPQRTLDPLLGKPEFAATSIQFSPGNADEFTETWRARSRDAGWPWVIDLDEVAPARVGLTDTNTDSLRRQVLYPVYFSGGNLEWYFGYHNLPLGGDLKTEDFRTREAMYRYMRIARQFMQDHLPFVDMQPNDAALSGGDTGDQVFEKPGDVYALYLLDGVEGRQLSVADGSYELRWFDPRNGGFVGEPITLQGSSLSLGGAPEAQDQDWVALVRKPPETTDTGGGNDGSSSDNDQENGSETNTGETGTGTGTETPDPEEPELGGAEPGEPVTEGPVDTEGVINPQGGDATVAPAAEPSAGSGVQSATSGGGALPLFTLLCLAGAAVIRRGEKSSVCTVVQ